MSFFHVLLTSFMNSFLYCTFIAVILSLDSLLFVVLSHVASTSYHKQDWSQVTCYDLSLLYNLYPPIILFQSLQKGDDQVIQLVSAKSILLYI